LCITISFKRENNHTKIADTRLDHYFLLGDEGQAKGIQPATGARGKKQMVI